MHLLKPYLSSVGVTRYTTLTWLEWIVIEYFGMRTVAKIPYTFETIPADKATIDVQKVKHCRVLSNVLLYELGYIGPTAVTVREPANPMQDIEQVF